MKRWTVGTLSAEQFRNNFKTWNAPGVYRFVACLREDGRMIGDIALSQVVYGRLRSAYFGYSVGAPYARQGYMQEAAALALRFAFNTLKLNRVEANIQPGNARSIALAHRLGFSLEGYSRRYLKIAGGWRDHQRWAMLASEWKPRRRIRSPNIETAADDIVIRDLGLTDIAAFAVLRHRLAREGDFALTEAGESTASNKTIAEQIANTLKDPLTIRIVAVHRGRLIGYVSATRGDTSRTRHAGNLAIGIVAAYTGKGLGKRLMDALEAWGREVGVTRLDLRVMVQNGRAIALYLRCGFSIEGRIRGEFCIDGKLVDAYVMGKILD